VLTSLTGCDKPTPEVTAFSGRHSAQAQAVCWNPEPARVSAGDCQVVGSKAPTIEVVPGSTVGISVDKEIADSGWIPAIGNQRLTPGTLSDTYYRLALSESDLRNSPLELRIFAVAGSESQTRGLWLFELKRAS
jgi:hypothetical protein